jgi:two-component system response regulator RegA
MSKASEIYINNDRSLMIIDDDDVFRNRLITAMKRKGYEAFGASSVSEAITLVNANAPKYAVIDLRLNDGNGLEVVSILSSKRPDSKIVMLTGYGNIPTAVAAVKEGACDYLAKPADADDIEAALKAPYSSTPEPPLNPMSADRVKWEHILRVYELCNRNVSETARRLKMHRRTLQRILQKKSPK